MKNKKIHFVLPDNLNSLGILGHLIIVNKSVHSDQIKCLEQYLSVCDISMEKTCLPSILDGKDDALSFDWALDTFGTESQPIQECLYYLLAELAYVDGCLDSAEKTLIHQVRCNSKITPECCAALLDQARQDAQSIHSDSNVPFTYPYKNSVEGDYISAIGKCAEIAKDDFSVVRPAYEWLISQCDDTVKELAKLKASFNQETDISAEVVQVISSFADCLSKNVLSHSREAYLDMLQKERTLSDFTITLLGRTKAGKSTLHSILTGQGRDRIGVGMQRTTRYNYVYQWNLLRLIDTPGIGAAVDKGREDELIAASVLGESDIICLVVVDDSILDDELEFMKKLAALNKPIIILLNHKENIEAEAKFQRFKDHPKDWLTSTGENRLQGYIDRIRRYAQQEGFASLLSVYPVFLLSALMAQEEKYAQDSKLLWDSSNMDAFIAQLEEWITVSGPLNRSQTLIDGTVQNFSSAQQAIFQGLLLVENKLDRLTRDSSTILNNSRKRQGVLLEEVKRCLEKQYERLTKDVALTFAEEHWNYKGDLSSEWSRYIEDIRFAECVDAEIDELISQFEAEINTAVREMVEDFLFAFEVTQIEIHNPLFLNFRGFAKIFGGLVGLAGAIVALIPGVNVVVGLVLAGGGALIELAAELLKSPQKKRKEAIDKIYESLGNGIRKKSFKNIENVISQIRNETDHVIANLETLFDHLKEGLKQAIEIGYGLTASYAYQIQSLNAIYAWRILTFLMGRMEPYQQNKVDYLVRNVERTNGKIRIVTPVKVNLASDALKNVIAEEIEVVTMEV